MINKYKDTLNFLHKNKVFVFFSAIISIFFLFFTRLMIKTDDGNFLGITAIENYNIFQFLEYRYKNISPRSVGEFLLMFFINHNIILWTLISVFLILYTVWFWIKLSTFFTYDKNSNKVKIFCCSGMFLMIISCLNPSVFWYSGSFSYLWPFAFMIITLSPYIFYLLGDKLNTKLIIISFFSSIIATSQEQSAACTICLYLITVIFLIYKKKFKLVLITPLVPILTTIYFMVTCPGIKKRILMESQNGFKGFSEFNIIEKLSCGLCVYFANCFYLSIILILVFIGLLSLVVYQKNNKLKLTLIILNSFIIFATTIFNITICIVKKSMPHITIRESILTGNISIYTKLYFIFGVIISFIITYLILKLIKFDTRTGIIILLLFLASMCCALVMGFSSSIFNSGQRVYFYSNMFIITCCVILFAQAKETKLRNFIFKSSVIYSSLSFIINFVAFKFIEHPLMG